MTNALAREVKRVAGRTETPETPLNVRTTGVNLVKEERGYFRVRLGKKLGKFSPHIERVTVRVEDTNGPKGGVDIECRIKVVLSGLPSVIVSETAETVPLAFNKAADRTVRAVRKAIDSSGTRAPKVARRAGAAAKAASTTTSARKAPAARKAARASTKPDEQLRRDNQLHRKNLREIRAPGARAVRASAKKRGTDKV